MTNVFGDPPAWFDEEKRAIRAQLIEEAPPGLWMRCDKWGLEVISVSVARCRLPDAKPSEFRQLLSMLDKFGLNPRSRKRIMAANARKAAKSCPN